MNPEIASRLLTVLLGFYSHGIGMERIRNHQQEIVDNLVDAVSQYPSVPPALLISVGLLETHLGYDSGEGGCWGSPIDRRHRHTSGGPVAAARDLAHSFQVCHDWLHAMHRYRVGLCNGREHVGYTAQTAMSLAERLSQAAEQPLPASWRAPEPAHE